MLNAGYAPARHSGWYLAAIVDELTGPVTALRIADRRLIVVRGRDSDFRVYDAVCPHRGADLGHGGTLTRAGIVCPFHGKAVALGERAGSRYSVPELPSFRAGPALFVALLPGAVDDRGFRLRMTKLAATHRLFPCPPADIAVPQELVVENAFDLDHFIQVHRIPRVTAAGHGRTETGAAFCEARFEVRMPAWEGGAGPAADAVIQNRFHATAFSPSIVLSELGAPGTGQAVITTAVPTVSGCRVRVLNALRPQPDGTVPEHAVRALTEGARKALDQDAPIWNNMDLSMTPTFDPRDEPVLLFRDFCQGFADLAVRHALC